MFQVVLIIHLLLAVGIIGLVMIQPGKGADAGASLGGGGSNSVFGAAGGATVFSRLTALLATLFFVTSLVLAYLAADAHKSKTSVVEQVEQVQPETDLPTIPVGQ